MSEPTRLGYLWGEDAFGIERALVAFAAGLGTPDAPIDVWRTDPDDADESDGGSGGGGGAGAGGGGGAAARRRTRQLEEIEAHLMMAPLFGPGTLVVVRQPGALLLDAASRERLTGLVRSVPEGNALCFSDLLGGDGKMPANRATLRDAVAQAGGLVRELAVPTRERMDAWLTARAAELGVRLTPEAARALAERIGAYVRETDVDRRRQTELANGELQKLALYKPGGAIAATDVAELVAETVPGSTWAFLDAVGMRRAPDAIALLERLLADGTAVPVIVAQLHRRVRELISIRDLLDEGTRLADVARVRRLQQYRAQRLGEQAGRWTIRELVAAIDGLVEVDLRSKGIALDGRTMQMSERFDALALGAWLADHARPRATATVPSATRTRPVRARA